MNGIGSSLGRFAAAIGLAVAAIGFRFWLQPMLGFDHHNGVLLVAVSLAAVLLGMWPALLVTVVGSLELHLAAHGHVLPGTIEEFAGLVVLVCEGIVITAAIEMQRRVRQRLRYNQVRELEARRADSEGRFMALADSVPALIWMSGEDGGWEYFNSAWYELTGRTAEEQCGYGWTASIHPDDVVSCSATYRSAFESRTPFQMEYRLKDKNGAYRWVSNRGSPRHSTGGRFVGFVGSCVDVTDHKVAEEASREAEAQLRRLNAELERFSGELARTNVELELQNRTIQRSNEQKARFLATMSHELRTPMNSVLGFVDLLSEETAGPLTVKQLRFLTHIRTAGLHLLRLVENVLDYSRLEAGHLQLDVQEFEARAVVQEVVAGVLQIDRDKLVKILLDVPDDFIVSADRQRFRQILYNLASNAFKFTPNGGQITVSATQDDSFTYLSVRDTGVGIARDQLGPVFEEFHQASSTQQDKGAGLGLAITQRLVHVHGGSISVESSVGEGTCFTFSLPKTKRPSSPPSEESHESHKHDRVESAQARIEG